MANKKQPEANEEATDDRKPRRRGLILGGGIVGLVGVAYMLFLMAVPRVRGEVPYEPAKVVLLTEEQVQVNLKGTGKDYLLMALKCQYRAYDPATVVERVSDPDYVAYQKDVLVRKARQKTKAELGEKAGEEAFLAEIRAALNPLLFPIEIGDAPDQYTPDSKSGLRAGQSVALSTMRGGYFRHVIHVDGVGRTLALDEGEPVKYDGSETDLALENENGRTIYVNTTQVDPDFRGEVAVGTQGTILRILCDEFIVQ